MYNQPHPLSSWNIWTLTKIDKNTDYCYWLLPAKYIEMNGIRHITVYGVELPYSDKVKNLEITFNSTLTWTETVVDKCNKVFAAIHYNDFYLCILNYFYFGHQPFHTLYTVHLSEGM